MFIVRFFFSLTKNQSCCWKELAHVLICNHVSENCNAVKSPAGEKKKIYLKASLKHDATKQVLLHFAEF